MSWDDLPRELVDVIWHWRTVCMLPHVAARHIQSQWRCYRTRVLLGRFKMLRYLYEFRQWNPSATTFLARARL